MSARILVIDDESNLRNMIRLTLQHAGYSVEIAENGAEGLTVFGDGQRFELVLLDQKLPGIQGTDVLQSMMKTNPEAKVILISAHGTMDLAIEAMHAGASDFLRKPFSAVTLRNAVQATLDRPKSTDSAVPVAQVCREFTRSSVNGFSIDFNHESEDESHHQRTFIFNVSAARGDTEQVEVILPCYSTELVLAYADTENPPGGNRFWQAFCEEALAAHLWEFAALPDGKSLVITDLTGHLERWIDSILTVSVAG
jgi:hypothetical protein